MDTPEPRHPERNEERRLQTPSAQWFISVAGSTLVAKGSSASGPKDEITIGTVHAGWDAAVDNDGTPWIVWSDGNLVHARRAPEGVWGPVLQVSTGTDNLHPRVIPDTYGNVWVVWWRRSKSEIWMCRMGPRSGQETKVASGASGPVSSVGITEGTLRIVLADGRIAVGTENGGFTVNTLPL